MPDVALPSTLTLMQSNSWIDFRGQVAVEVGRGLGAPPGGLRRQAHRPNFFRIDPLQISFVRAREEFCLYL